MNRFFLDCDLGVLLLLLLGVGRRIFIIGIVVWRKFMGGVRNEVIRWVIYIIHTRIITVGIGAKVIRLVLVKV